MTLLDKLEKLARAATPGPWKADIGNWQIENDDLGYVGYRDGICSFTPADRDGCNGRDNPINPIDDAEFIAAANPTTVLKLIEAIRVMRQALALANEDWADTALIKCREILER